MVMDGLIFGATCLLAYAALHDLAVRTVPNWLPLCLLIIGFTARLLDHTLREATVTASITFVVLFAVWFGGVMGGGDVKLWAATVLLIPPHWQIELSFFLQVFLIGGLLGVLYLALWFVARKWPAGVAWLSELSGSMPRRFIARIYRAELWRISRRGPLPYAVAISGSAILTLLPLSLQK